MSWSEKNMDELFKEAYSHQAVPEFKEAFFDEVADLLPPEKKRRLPFFWMFSGLFAVVASIGLLWFFNGNTGKDTLVAKNDKSGDKVSVQKKQAAQPISENQGEKVQQAEQGNQQNTSNKIADKYDIPPTRSSAPPVWTRYDNAIDNGLIRPKTTATDDQIVATGSSPATNASSEINTDEPLTLSLTKLNHHPILPFNTEVDSILDSFITIVPKIPNTHKIAFEMAAGLNQSFVKPLPGHRAYGQNFAIGLSYNFQFKQNFIQQKLTYGLIMPGEMELNRSSKVYGFDATHYSQQIRFKSINTINYTLSFGRQVKSNRFSMDLSPYYVMGSFVQFQNTKNSETTAKETVFQNSIGLKRFGLMAGLSYEKQLRPSTFIGINVSGTIINPIDQTKFVNQQQNFALFTQINFKQYFSFKCKKH